MQLLKALSIIGITVSSVVAVSASMGIAQDTTIEEMPVLPAASTTANVSATATDFSGTWLLDLEASDSFDPILAAQGIPQFQRRAINNASVTQVITQTDSALTIEAKTAFGSRQEDLNFDGQTRTVSSQLGTGATRSFWESNGALVTTFSGTSNQGRPIDATVSRSLADNGQTMVQTIELQAADGSTFIADRVFRKQ